MCVQPGLERRRTGRNVLELRRGLYMTPVFKKTDIDAGKPERADQVQRFVVRDQGKCKITAG